MITDDQGTQILKKMDTKFGEMDTKFGEMDTKFGEIDTKLEKISTILEEHTVILNEHSATLEEHSAILKKHSYSIDQMIPMLVNHDNMLKSLPTRDEFNEFREENAVAHDHMAKSMERLEQESKAGAKAQDRIKERVDTHERVLIAHKLLPAKAV